MSNTPNPTKKEIAQIEGAPVEEVNLKPIELLFSKVGMLLNPTGDLDTDKLFSQVERAIKQLKPDVFKVILSHESENFVERYVKFNQNALISLCNEVIEYPNTDESFYPGELEKLLRVYESLEGHLNYIEKAFPAYFEQKSNVPVGLCLKKQFDFRERINRVQEKTDCELFKIAIKPIEDFIFSKNITYRKLYYLQGLMTVIEKCYNESSGRCKLRDKLIQCNFNSNEFFLYVAQGITNEISSDISNEKKTWILYYHLKSINNIAVNEGLCLIGGYKPINERLVNWLIDEIEFLKIGVPLEVFTKKEESNGNPTPLKLETALTIGRLACLIRAMVDAGLFPDVHKTKIIRFFTQHFSAKNTKDISSVSFRNGFYNPSEADRRKVKEILQQALKKLS